MPIERIDQPGDAKNKPDGYLVDMVYTDFDGKPTSFVPGREVANKEPAVS